MTPALTTDLKKILAKCRYPLYILVNQSQAFRLCGSDFGINNGVLNNISFGFARPFCFAAFHDLKRLQLVRIGNWGKNAFGKRRAWLTWTNFQPRMISEGLLQPPTEFQGLLGAPGGAIDLARWEQLFAETAWEPYSGSGLHFNMAYWDGEQVPVGWAYSAEEEPLVVVAALGVPRSDFLEVLQSLVILHQNDEPLIGNFQEEMRTAMEEFGRNRRRKSQ